MNTTANDAHALETASVHYNLVEGDFVTLATRKTKEPLVRPVMERADGLMAVRIVDAHGQVRMEGIYADAALHVPHGTFHYYYPSGAMESEGEYVQGRKTGIWKCYTPDGVHRSDRSYHGLEWDDLQIVVGLATRATRHAF
ncbi:MAG: hypothetical protein ABI599_11600 [Flavobacteriales bacterium]